MDKDKALLKDAKDKKTAKTTANKASARPSDRMFRRSRAAENRRRSSQNKEARFFKLVYSLSGIGIFVVFIAIILVAKAYGQEAEPVLPDNALTRPVIGEFSWLDLMGLAFVGVAGYAVFRKYGRKK